MKLAVVTNDRLKEEFLSKPIPGSASLCFVKDPRDIPADSSVIFDLLFVCNRERISQLRQFLPRPVFVNAVAHTLSRIQAPFIRINAWPTFLGRAIAEIATLPGDEYLAEDLLGKLGWKYQLVPDITGMISPRITGAIINEAYFTLDEKVSTKEEIDTAMKLGTGYPFGPFEWCEKIGVKAVREMLVQLSNENNLYEVSTLFMNENIV